MGKDKFTVAGFVKVMTGGKVELDESSKVARSNATADLLAIEDMIAQLARLEVTSTQLDQARQGYFTDFSTAAALKKKADQTKAFNALSKAMKLHVNAAKGPFPSWLALAQEQQRLNKAIDQKLTEKQGRVDKLPFDTVKAALTRRIQGWRSNVNIVLATEVTGLPKAMAELKRLQVELDDGDIDRYFALAAQLESLKIRLASEISAAEGRVDEVKPPELAKFVAKRLAEFKSRQVALNGPITDLFDLVNKCQGIGDLCDEVAHTDFAEIGNMETRYETLEKELRTQLQVDAAKLSKLPNLPFAKEIRQQIVDCLNKIQPRSQITGPSALATALKGIEKLVTDYKDAPGSVDANIREAKECQEWFVKMQAAYDAKRKQAEALPPSFIRDQILGSLESLLKEAKPLEEMKSMADVIAAARNNKNFTEHMESFDVDGYEAGAKPYQAALMNFDQAYRNKAQDVENLPDGPAKDALRKSLEALKGKTTPVEKVTEVSSFPGRTKTVAGLEERVRAIDVATVVNTVATHAEQLAALKDNIDKKIADIGKNLNPGALKVLRDEYAAKFEQLSRIGTAEDAAEKLEKIKELETSLEQRQIPTDKELDLRFKKADGRIDKTQKQIDKLPTPELREAAQSALDDLKKNLDQLRIGSAPSRIMPALAVGHPSKAENLPIPVKASEQTRTVDLAIKALGDMLADKTGTRMLELVGGLGLSEKLCDIYSKQVVHGASHAGISPAEAIAVNGYTGDDYDAMNKVRRGEKVGDQKEEERLTFLNRVCDQALKKMPPYPAAAWPTFRGENAWSQDVVDKRYGKGRQFVCGQPWSTGARTEAPQGSGASPHFLHVIYGKNGRDVAFLSAFQGEGGNKQQKGYEFNPMSGRGEVLFPADSSFLVKERVDPVDKATGKPMEVKYDPDGFGVNVTTTLKEVSNG